MEDYFDVKRFLITASILSMLVISGCGSKSKLEIRSKKANQSRSSTSVPPTSAPSASATPATETPLVAGPNDTTGPHDASATNQDLKVIPPEVVSGAYLTCNFIPPAETPREEESAYYGCGTASKSHDPEFQNVKRHYTLTNHDGKKLDADEIDIPGRPEEIIWQIPISIISEGFHAHVLLRLTEDDSGYLISQAVSFDSFLTFMKNFLSAAQIELLKAAMLVNLGTLWDQIILELYGPSESTAEVPRARGSTR